MFGTKQISKAKKAVKQTASKAPAPKKVAQQVKKAAPKNVKLPSNKQAKQAIKKAIPTKAAKAAGSQLRKAVPNKAVGTRMGGAGYRKFEGDALWLPNTNRPEWLDGTLPGAPRGSVTDPEATAPCARRFALRAGKCKAIRQCGCLSTVVVVRSARAAARARAQRPRRLREQSRNPACVGPSSTAAPACAAELAQMHAQCQLLRCAFSAAVARERVSRFVWPLTCHGLARA